MSEGYWEANIQRLLTCTVLSHYFTFNQFILANLISTSDDTLTAMMIGIEQHSDSKYNIYKFKRSLLVTYFHM